MNSASGAGEEASPGGNQAGGLVVEEVDSSSRILGHWPPDRGLPFIFSIALADAEHRSRDLRAICEREGATLDARVATVEDAEEALRRRVWEAKASFDWERSDLHHHREAIEEIRLEVARSIQGADEHEALLSRHAIELESRRAIELDDRATALAHHEEDLSPLKNGAISREVALVVREALIGEAEGEVAQRVSKLEILLNVARAARDKVTEEATWLFEERESHLAQLR